MGCKTDKLPEKQLAMWLGFDQVRGISLAEKKLLYDRLGSIEEIWTASTSDLTNVHMVPPRMAEAFAQSREGVDTDKLLRKVRAAGVEPLPYGHDFYSRLLRQIHDPPMVLYTVGEIRETDFISTIAVVGTRKTTGYGQKVAKDMGRGLSACGVTVVSGMAIGIDSLAHWGAIEGGGRTVAVVACGPELCYPSSNRPLYDEIAAGKGLIVSEYFPGTKPDKFRFPARNRIISGLSAATVVVEAGDESGALITAQMAFDQSRQVFAVPGRVDSNASIGTLRLIATQRAHMVRDHNDVLTSLDWVTRRDGQMVASIVELFGREREIFDMITAEPIHFDTLCETAGLGPGEMSATLTMLELAGLVIREQGDWYFRNSPGLIVPKIPTIPTLPESGS